MNRIALALPLLAIVSTGCVEVPLAIAIADALDNGNAGDVDYYDEYDEYDDYDDYADDYANEDDFYQERQVVEGRMTGSLPANGTFDREVTEGVVWDSGVWIDFEVHATGSAWAMIAGSVDTTRLQEGVPTDLSGGEANLLGCSGPVPYSYDFDEPAETIVVTEETVEIDGEQAVQYTFVGTFRNGDEVTTVVVVPASDDE